jgi:orotidine-5'-phosphate decarboxylase
MPLTAKEKIIVALDVPDEDAALRALDTLRDGVGFYKIGMQLFTRCGPAIVRRVRDTGARVFLDLKFHDIPNTVRHAVRSTCEIGVDMLTIHLSGGSEMIRAAVAGSVEPVSAPSQSGAIADADAAATLILGVTVLTSSTRETLREIAIDAAVEDQVLRLARLAVENGVRGIVASPQEVTLLRQIFTDKLTIVTPGVRPAWAAANDQQRTMTPAAAIRAGADYLVIGRPILAHASPREAAQRIAEEIENVQ